LSKRLAAVVRAWVTRRLLWIWLFAYACVLTSAYFWPVRPRDNYFECPRWSLPAKVIDSQIAVRQFEGEAQLSVLTSARSLIARRQTSGAADMRRVKASVGYMPQLEAIFAGNFHDDPAGFRHLREMVPEIRVWHLDFNVGRLASLVFLLLATLTLGGAVVQQTSAMLSVPQAQLYPRYPIVHLAIPLTICVAGIGAASRIAGGYGSNFWAAASIQTLGWGFWAALEFLWLPVRRSLSGAWTAGREVRAAATDFRSRGIEVAAVVVLLAAAYLIASHLYVVESFLLGELPWLNAAFIAVGAVLGGAALASAPRFVVELAESGVAPVLSMQDVEKRRPVAVLTSPFRGSSFRLRRPKAGPTWWWRIHAMQAGNPDLFYPVLVKFIAPIAVLAICEESFALGIFARLLVLLLATVGSIAGLSSCFSIWWQRRKAFSSELLYPWTRRQLTLAAFAAYGLDVVGVLLIWPAVAACAGALDWHVGSRDMLLAVLMVVAAISALAAGGLWLLTLRHRLLASFIAFVAVVIVVTCVAFEWPTVVWRNGHMLSTGALPYALATVLFGIAAYRRWTRSEWGLFGPL
jgi:hypothetical protein